jgi:hypothetical protein
VRKEFHTLKFSAKLLTSSPNTRWVPPVACPTNSFPLSDCKIAGGPIKVKIFNRENAMDAALLATIGIEIANLVPLSRYS